MYTSFGKKSSQKLGLLLALLATSACAPDDLSKLISPSDPQASSSSSSPDPRPMPSGSVAGSLSPDAQFRPGEPVLASRRPFDPVLRSPIPFATMTPQAVLITASPGTVTAVGFYPGANLQTLLLNDPLALDMSAPGPVYGGNPNTMLYFGHDVIDAELTFRYPANSIASPNGIKVYSGAGNLIATLDNNSPDDTAPFVPVQGGPPDMIETRVSVPGNYAYLFGIWDASSTRPAVTLSKIRSNHQLNVLPTPQVYMRGIINGAVNSTVPEIAPIDRVTSLQVVPGSPVMLYAPPNGKKTFFMTVPKTGTRTVNMSLEGAGEVIVGDASTGFLLPGSELGLDRLSTSSGGSLSFPPVSPPRDTLLLTVTINGPTVPVSLQPTAIPRGEVAPKFGKARLKVDW